MDVYCELALELWSDLRPECIYWPAVSVGQQAYQNWNGESDRRSNASKSRYVRTSSSLYAYWKLNLANINATQAFLLLPQCISIDHPPSVVLHPAPI